MAPELNMSLQEPNDQVLNARVRLATESDVPFVNKLIHKMAEYYDLSHECKATEASLFTALFGHSKHEPQTPNPFGCTVSVYLIEASSTPLSAPPLQQCRAIDKEGHGFEPDTFYKTVHLDHHLNHELKLDHEESLFLTEEGTIIAGFVIFFPSYSTFLTKPGIHMEDLFIRKGYRGMGFGKLLIKAVANLTVRLGYARMEWTVIDWNVASHRFYEKLGAHLLNDWRIFRLDGDSLQSYGQLN